MAARAFLARGCLAVVLAGSLLATGVSAAPSASSHHDPRLAVAGESDTPPAGPSAKATTAEDGLSTVDLTTPGFAAQSSTEPAKPPRPSLYADQDLEPAAVSGEISADSFRLVAVTWDGDAGDTELAAWVRTRTAGKWTDWYEIPHDSEHGPEADGVEDDVRAGTDPLIVAASDAVQVRVDTADGTVPPGLRLDLVDPGDVPEARAEAAESVDTSEPAAARRPTIRTRAQWGADESLRGPDLTYARVDGAFVHHTVSANAYEPGEVPAMIRGIYRYHVRSRGWNDIGYNFLIDRFGRIWEGRHGGVDRAVQGAHTAGYNDDAFGAAALGTYTSKSAEPRLVEAFQNLIAWKFRVHGVDPRKPVNYDGEKWPAVAGHRDAASTVCPGDGLYRALPTIRRGVQALMYGKLPTLSGLPRSPSAQELIARRMSDHSLWRYRGTGHPQLVGTHWNSMNALAFGGAGNGDRWPDLLARKRTDGSLWFYAGRADGHLNAPRRAGTSWHTMDIIVGAGAWTDTPYGDLIARRASDGALWLYPGAAGGKRGKPIRIGNRWTSMDLLTVPGDMTGDGRPDLLARKISDGTLWLYPGRGKRGLGKARQIGHGWRTIEQATGVGDWNGNGYADIVVTRPDGTLWLYLTRSTGTFAPAIKIGTGWQGMKPVVGMLAK